MRLNENTAILTPKVTLVPYDRRHVPRYHEWMSDPKIQEATASEPLTLEEEYENQESWRASRDKLTFILCQPLPAAEDGVAVDEPRAALITSGEVDAPDRMLGDINFFLYPDDEDEDEDEDEDKDQENGHVQGADDAQKQQQKRKKLCVGEVDIMIAGEQDRGKGLGTAAVATFLHYISSHLDAILAEYSSASAPRLSRSKEDEEGGEEGEEEEARGLELKLFMAKIQATNLGSIALFKRLGFEQEGEVNYFGEVKMVLKEFGGLVGGLDGYNVVEYKRRTVD